MRPATLAVAGTVLMVGAMLPLVLAAPGGGASALAATLVLAHGIVAVVFAPVLVHGQRADVYTALTVLVTGPWPLLALAVHVSDVSVIVMLAGEALVALAAVLLALAAWRWQRLGGHLSWAPLAPPVLQFAGLGLLLASWPRWSPWLTS